jgi:hypothetical protein
LRWKRQFIQKSGREASCKAGSDQKTEKKMGDNIKMDLKIMKWVVRMGLA